MYMYIIICQLLMSLSVKSQQPLLTLSPLTSIPEQDRSWQIPTAVFGEWNV